MTNIILSPGQSIVMTLPDGSKVVMTHAGLNRQHIDCVSLASEAYDPNGVPTREIPIKRSATRMRSRPLREQINARKEAR